MRQSMTIKHPSRQRPLSRTAAVAVAAIVLAAALPATARDDGRYANEPLHEWFDQLASGKGLCCSFADGFTISDVEYGVRCEQAPAAGSAEDCHFWVALHGEIITVPDSAIVTEPNKFGPAVVWPYLDAEGATQIRCFLPGAGA